MTCTSETDPGGYTASMTPYVHPLFHDPSLAPGPSVDDARIASAEERLGRRLPEAYTRALRATNGGRLRRSRLHPRQGPAPHLDLRDLLGVGYEDGVDGAEGSEALIGEWDYPAPAVVISFEGRCALLLDYRSCGPQGEPAVIWVDTDTDMEWTVADSFAELLRRLRYPAERTQIALPADAIADKGDAIGLCEALGAAGPVRPDWTGAQNLLLGGQVLRVRPNRYRDIVVAPELETGWPWILEAEHREGDAAAIIEAVNERISGALLLSFSTEKVPR